MREILFRGKRIDNGEWVEGCLVIATDGGEAVYYILPVGVERWGGAEFAEGWSVDPKTVGQYTGLCDKNGETIFEGDIVEEYNIWDEFKRIGTVSWHDLFCGWHTGKPNAMHNGPVASYVIIGNIHDKPELLEVDNGT